MGGWKLESGKMALYISFPVILFYVFNQPKYFEDWVTQKRQSPDINPMKHLVPHEEVFKEHEHLNCRSWKLVREINETNCHPNPGLSV
ncbi:hypothetical protein Avbf_08465 [Armadillidium vulgare]|nr:hypothetical protein Avbf_08465 [Armadillidium vulgare]